MKTNLDKFFKTSKDFEKEGVWFDLNDETGFRVKRFGGYNSPAIKAIIAKKYKPYARQIEKGTLSESKEREIMTSMFISVAMVDWKGVEINGEIKEYSPELALEFFMGLPELLETLTQYASDSENYREELGNS